MGWAWSDTAPCTDLFFIADVEADGPIPGPYSMLSFGLAVAGAYDGTGFERWDPTDTTFYRELRPISEHADPESLAVSKLDRGRLIVEGGTARAPGEANGVAAPAIEGPTEQDWLDASDVRDSGTPASRRSRSSFSVTCACPSCAST